MKISTRELARVRKMRSSPGNLETLRRIDAFEIDGKLWFNLVDVARALKFNEQDISYARQHMFRNSMHVRKLMQYVGPEQIPSKRTILDTRGVELVATRFSFLPVNDVLNALPKVGLRVDGDRVPRRFVP